MLSIQISGYSLFCLSLLCVAQLFLKLREYSMVTGHYAAAEKFRGNHVAPGHLQVVPRDIPPFTRWQRSASRWSKISFPEKAALEGALYGIITCWSPTLPQTMPSPGSPNFQVFPNPKLATLLRREQNCAVKMIKTHTHTHKTTDTYSVEDHLESIFLENCIPSFGTK